MVVSLPRKSKRDGEKVTKKVLIVEDSLLLHKIYEMVLKSYTRFDLEPHFAADGHQGLVKLQEHPDTDLILLDVNMPTMSGLEFLRRVRAEPVFESITVVMQSTEDHEKDIQRAMESGAAGYLTKPFTTSQLHELLDSIFEEAAPSAEAK